MFIHSTDNEHFNHIHFLEIINRATMISHIKSLDEHGLSFLAGKNLGVEWLDHMAD